MVFFSFFTPQKIKVCDFKIKKRGNFKNVKWTVSSNENFIGQSKTTGKDFAIVTLGGMGERGEVFMPVKVADKLKEGKNYHFEFQLGNKGIVYNSHQEA